MTNPDVLRCLEKAAECDRRAEQAIDEESRAAYRRLAESFQRSDYAAYFASLPRANRVEPSLHL